MKVSKTIIKKANTIISKYCRNYIQPKLLQTMYQELEDMGVTTGIITGDCQNSSKTCEWYFLGEEVNNSQYVYSIHKSECTNNIEYNIYFS